MFSPVALWSKITNLIKRPNDQSNRSDSQPRAWRRILRGKNSVVAIGAAYEGYQGGTPEFVSLKLVIFVFLFHRIFKINVKMSVDYLHHFYY